MNVQGAPWLPGFAGGHLKMVHALEEVSEGDAGFHAGESGAEAGMDAVTEGDVEVGFAPDIKAVGLGEVFGIPIGRTNHGQNQPAGGHDLPVDFDVLAWRAHNPLDRGAEAQYFFNGGGQELGVLPDERQLLGKIQEAEQGIVDEVGGGFLTTKEQELEEA